MDSFFYLLAHREKPAILSVRWFKVWFKRSLYSFDLICLQFYRLILVLTGMRIGLLSDLHKTKVQGLPKNIQLGSFSFVGQAYLMCHALISVGDSVVINDRVTLLTSSHIIDDPFFKQFCAPICICNYAWICTGATILPGVTVGEGAVVAAFSVVTKDVPPYAVVAGNPARVVKSRLIQTYTYRPNLLRACYEAWLGH